MSHSTPKRNLATFLLVLGAVVFGMVLAGGLELTVPSSAQSQAAKLSATQMASGNQVISLPSFADLAEAVDPAVVSIQASSISDQPRGRQGQGQGVDPFEFFFGPRDRDRRGQPPQQQPEEFRSDSGGSGFVISADGLVVTNYHVIQDATDVKVHLGDRDYPAEVKGTDPATDIALLKIDAGRELRYLDLGDSERLRVGDWVMVIGSPLNLDKTVTTGVVSAKGRSLGISNVSFENFIQTDAAINFGNSGGPLVNLRGEVIGIATAINWGAENIGFAVPVNTLKQILPQLREKGRVSRGYLGVQIGNLDYQMAQAFGLETTDGALVQSVQEGTPAERAGLQHGDVILAVDGRPIENTRELINYVSAQGPEATVTLDVLRDGKRVEKRVKLSERPLDEAAAPVEEPEDRGGIDWLGLRYQDLTDNLRQMHELPGGVQGVLITQVSPRSPLYEQNVRPGAIITEVNGRKVGSTEEFENLVREVEQGAYLRFYIRQIGAQGAQFFVVVRKP
jgi:serine protease Do